MVGWMHWSNTFQSAISSMNIILVSPDAFTGAFTFNFFDFALKLVGLWCFAISGEWVFFLSCVKREGDRAYKSFGDTGSPYLKTTLI